MRQGLCPFVRVRPRSLVRRPPVCVRCPWSIFRHVTHLAAPAPAQLHRVGKLRRVDGFYPNRVQLTMHHVRADGSSQLRGPRAAGLRAPRRRRDCHRRSRRTPRSSPISLDLSQGPSTAALGTREHPRLGSGRSPSAPARLTARVQRPGRTRVTVIHRDQNLLLNFWNFVSQYFQLPSTQPREARIDEDGRLSLLVGEDRGGVGPRDWITAAPHGGWPRQSPCRPAVEAARRCLGFAATARPERCVRRRRPGRRAGRSPARRGMAR